MAKVSAILLGAGLSRRMGAQNKMALPYKGKPMMRHVHDQIKESLAFELIIVTSEHSQKLLDDIPVVLNEHYQRGMTSSIQAGVRSCSYIADGYMICLGDQPLIRPTEYNQIISHFSKHFPDDPKAIVIPTHKGIKGNPVILSTWYREAILQHEEPEGCKGIVKAHQQHVYRVELSTDGILNDVDRPEDYEKLISN